MNPNICHLSKDRIQLFRKNNGWSQEVLAKAAGVSVRTIQRVEKEGKCSLETHLALSSVFNLAPNELLDNYQGKLTAISFQLLMKQLIGLTLVACLIALTISIFGQLSWFIDGVGLAFVILFACSCTVITFSSTYLVKSIAALKFLFVRDIPNMPMIQFLSFVLDRQILFVYLGAIIYGLIGVIVIHANYPWPSVTTNPEVLKVYLYGQKLIPLLYATIIAELLLRPIVTKIKALDVDTF